MNKPYVKKFDVIGQIENPIKGSLLHFDDNRKKRRISKQPNRFYGESKNHHLTVVGSMKYLRLKQITKDKEGNRKVVEHYLLQ